MPWGLLIAAGGSTSLLLALTMTPALQAASPLAGTGLDFVPQLLPSVQTGGLFVSKVPAESGIEGSRGIRFRNNCTTRAGGSDRG
jgi:hypothetical protein